METREMIRENIKFAIIPQGLRYKSASSDYIEFNNNKERDAFCTFLNIIECRYIKEDCGVLFYNDKTKEDYANIIPMSLKLFLDWAPATGTRIILDEYAKNGTYDILVLIY